eukprot:445007_1
MATPAKRSTQASKTPSTGTSSGTSSHRPPSSSSSHRTPSSRGGSTRRQPRSSSKRDNVHRNVHIKQEDPAIWEHFRARTVQGTSIYIGKNTIIGPGVNIIAEKGTITIGDNNII